MFREDKERYPLDSADKRPPPLNPAFKLAVSLGVLASIRLHISRNDALDARDESGQTLLMIAARKNRAEACRLLLDAGADRSLFDLNGFTAEDLARAAGAQDALAVFALPSYEGLSPYVAESVTLSDAIGSMSIPLDSPISTNTSAALEDTDDGSWTPVEEKPPPEDSPGLRELAVVAQAKMSAHQPKDANAVQWDDVSGYLPTDVDIFGIPDHVEDGLRRMVLIGVREGEIQSAHLNALLTEVDSSTPDSLSRLTVQMLNDLGVEVDETFGPSDEWSHSRLSTELLATDVEAELQDEALQYLKGLLHGRNEPSRIFTKEAYVHPLLSQDSEVRLAQRMEQSVEAAIEYLSEWPSGLRALLARCEELKCGVRSLHSMQSNRTFEGGESEQAADESLGHPSTPASHQHDAEEDEDASVEAEESSDHLEEFILLAGSLQKLVDSSNQGSPEVALKTRQLLLQMRLAGPFLCSLSDPTDTSPAATGFANSNAKFLNARDQLVLSNLKLVVQFAKRYVRPGIDYLDLLQEGHIGLIRAVDRFDWRRGFKFSTMATWWIRQQVQRAAPELGLLIRLPVHAVEKSWLVKRYLREFEDEHGRAPTIAWLAEKMDMPVRKVEPILRCISEPLALDDLDKHEWLMEVLESNPVEAAQTSEATARAEKLLEAVGEKSGRRMAERVLRMRYGVGVHHELTLDEIGRRYGLTRERIRQIESKGIKLARIHLGLRPPETATSDDEQSPPRSQSHQGSRPEELHVKRARTTTAEKSASTMTQQEPRRGQSVSVSAFTPIQTELLYKAESIGLKVMTYKVGARYETLVVLTPRHVAAMQEMAADLIDAGFQYKPGHGYWI